MVTGRNHPARSASYAGEVLRALHERFLNHDEAAAGQIFEILVPRVRRALSARFHRVPLEWTHDAAVDALLDYYRSPQRFDAARGVPLSKWLEYPARRNLLNRLAVEDRRLRHETSITEADLEARPACAPDTLARFDFENLLRSMRSSFSPAEWGGALRLWICGERRTSVFACEAGLDGLSPREQRSEVKRLKDRVLKRLRRHSTASDTKN